MYHIRHLAHRRKTTKEMCLKVSFYLVTTSITYAVTVLEGRLILCHLLALKAGLPLVLFSLIAIMLGRLRMTVDDCIQEYEQLAGDIFGHANFSPNIPPDSMDEVSEIQHASC